MEYRTHGKILKGVGGLYTIKLCGADEHALHYGTPSPIASEIVACSASGALRHNRITPLVGDGVEVIYTDLSLADGGAKSKDIRISKILDRRNALIRPPLANLDVMFISMAATHPSPVLSTVDKLIAIAEHNGIEPVIIIGKQDLDSDAAEKIKEIYCRSGFSVFVLSAQTGEGTGALREFIENGLKRKTAAFAGASGVGKSTLLNRLFPDLSLQTNEISERIQRGKHTTRHVELYPISRGEDTGYIADTPGFSLLDFERFSFFDKEDLAYNMREFREYIGKCRYTKCSHTKEEGCAIIEAVRAGDIPKSRHESFVEIYETLKNKNKWNQ
jgi:ribosome biogenesis GTPase